MKTFVVLLTLTFLSNGCAWYSIRPIPASATTTGEWGRHSSDGYIFYQPELYFSASIDSIRSAGSARAQSVTVTPVYLPNYCKPYRLTTHSVFAKSDLEFQFQNGWALTQIADKSDNATMADALALQLKTVLAAGMSGVVCGSTNEASAHRVILYHPRFDLRTGILDGFDPVDAIDGLN